MTKGIVPYNDTIKVSATAQYNFMQARANVLIEAITLPIRIADWGENRPKGNYTKTQRKNDTAVVTDITQHSQADEWNLIFMGFSAYYSNIHVYISPSFQGYNDFYVNLGYFNSTSVYDLLNRIVSSNQLYGFILNHSHVSYKDNGFYKITMILPSGSKIIRYLDLRVPYPY